MLTTPTIVCNTSNVIGYDTYCTAALFTRVIELLQIETESVAVSTAGTTPSEFPAASTYMDVTNWKHTINMISTFLLLKLSDFGAACFPV